MMFPSSFFLVPDQTVTTLDVPVEPESCDLVSPGAVYRDSILFGVAPSMVNGGLYDDDGDPLLDPVSDLRVQATDLADPLFYPGHPEYARPENVKQVLDSVLPTAPTSMATPEVDAAPPTPATSE